MNSGQRGTVRQLQAVQLIEGTVKRSHIASDDDRLASEGIGSLKLVYPRSLLNSLDGNITFRLEAQSDFLSDSLGGGHGDDALGEERAAREERAEEDEEPDAELFTHSVARD